MTESAEPSVAETWEDYDRALRKLLHRPDLAENLKARESAEATAAALEISESMATSLKDVLISLHPGADPQSPDKPDLFKKTDKSIDFALGLLESSSGHVRRTVAISTGMSLVMFVIGSVLLVIAVARAITGDPGVGTTATIAGVGVAQIIALFYRNPLRDIADAAATAQRTNIAVMSYVLGIALIGESAYSGKKTADEFAELVSLTERTVASLDPAAAEHLKHRPDEAIAESAAQPAGKPA